MNWNNNFLKPRYWLIWLLNCIFYWLKFFPNIHFKLGKRVGTLLRYILKRRFHITKRNIDLCFPHLTNKEKHDLIKKNFEFAGISLLEHGILWHEGSRGIKQKYRIEGLEHYEKLKKKMYYYSVFITNV